MAGIELYIVWQEAKELTVLVYRLTNDFLKSEDYALKSQMRRAAVSVMSQVAEGWMRMSKKDKFHCLDMYCL